MDRPASCPEKLCGSCKRTGVQICDGCKDSTYCSTECQQQDRPLHETMCKSFADLPPRPSSMHYRAIFFPVNGDTPQFIWLEHEDSFGAEVPHGFKPYIQEQPYSGSLTLDCHRELGRPMDYFISITHNANFASDGSPQNRSLKNLIGNEYANYWRGSFVAHGTKGTLENLMEAENVVARDLDTTALRPIIDYLIFRRKYPYTQHSLEMDAEASEQELKTMFPNGI